MTNKDVRPSQEFKRFKVISPSEGLSKTLVISDQEITEDYLVVWIDIGLHVVYAINLDTTARFPIKLGYEELIEAIDDELLLLADHGVDPRVGMAPELLADGYRNKMEKRFTNIFPLTMDLESVLRNGYRDKVFSDVVADSRKSKQYIYDTFYSWLRHGCRKQGLGMPQGKDANRIPKTRSLSVKQGAPNAGIPRGKKLNDYDKKNFEIGKRLYRKKNGPSIDKTIRILWRKYYYRERTKNTPIDEKNTGDRFKVVLLPANERPTYYQFHYWLTKEYNGILPARDRPRSNATEYAANNKGRSGNAFSHVIAPGELFQLDETPFDEEIVSVLDPDRKTKLAKATLYFVRDTASRSIVGLYITTLNPSYGTVKEALFNCGRDIKAFLEEKGSHVDPDLLDVRGMPQSLLVDRAEFHNKLSEGPIEDLPISIKFTRSGRGDDKPHIETMFNVFRKFFEGISTALQTASQRDIALQLARKKACLTIAELYEIAFVFIAHYNNSHVIEGYPLTKEMIRDGVKAIPVQLWRWGLRNRPGYLSHFSDSELYLNLLEKGEVSVHRTHIYLLGKKTHYNCEWTLEEGLQDRRSSGNKALRLPCRYFRGCVDIIFICAPDGLKIATLDARDVAYSGMSFEEVDAAKRDGLVEHELLLEAELNSLASAEGFLEGVVSHANKQRKPSAMQTIRTIKDKRKVESYFDRVDQLNRFRLAVLGEYSISQDDGENSLQSDEDSYSHEDQDSFYGEG